MIRNIAIRNSILLPNLGKIDRVGRCLIGILLIGATLTGFAPNIAAIIAIPVVFMGLIAWDPIYEIIGFNTTARRTLGQPVNLKDTDNIITQAKKSALDLQKNNHDELLNKVA